MNQLTCLDAEYTLAWMTEHDIHAVHEIETLSQDFPWSQKLLTDAVASGAWVVKGKDGHSLAFCFFMVILDEMHLLNIAVHPNARRAGIASKLLLALHHYAVEQTCVCVFLEVRASNEGAIGLYKKLGYEQISIRRAYYPAFNGREDAVIMRKPLGGLQS